MSESKDPKKQVDHDEQEADKRASAIAEFILELAKEGERSAVVLGASRADTALDELLKRFLLSHPGGTDNLFDPDRPLGTFSSKIAVAFRLGLVDRSCEHALQMLRRIRNEFAHSISHSTLSESRHKGRVAEIVIEAKKCGPYYGDIFKQLHKISNAPLRAFCAATGVVIAILDHAAANVGAVRPSYMATLDRTNGAKS